MRAETLSMTEGEFFERRHSTAAIKFTITTASDARQLEWNDRRSMKWADGEKMFRVHKIGQKDGLCYTPAIFKGKSRKKDEAQQIGILALDSDSGATLESIRAALLKRGWAAIIHSTFNHMTMATAVGRTAFVAFEKENPAGAAETFLSDKKGMMQEIVAGAEVIERQEKNVIIRHNPCPKFRIIMPLATPWIAAEFPTQDMANEYWKDSVNAVAACFGLHHDQACTDTSRLFYFPRHVEGAEYVAEAVDGIACDLTEVALNG